MKLHEYFKKHGLRYTRWVREHPGLNNVSICTHLAWEKTGAGSRLGWDLSLLVVNATKGEVTLQDLHPEKADLITRACRYSLLPDGL